LWLVAETSLGSFMSRRQNGTALPRRPGYEEM